MAILGIDIGTTTVCVKAVGDGDCRELLSRTVKNDSFIATPNAYERIQDPERILSTVRALLAEVKGADVLYITLSNLLMIFEVIFAIYGFTVTLGFFRRRSVLRTTLLSKILALTKKLPAKPFPRI